MKAGCSWGFGSCERWHLSQFWKWLRHLQVTHFCFWQGDCHHGNTAFWLCGVITRWRCALGGEWGNWWVHRGKDGGRDRDNVESLLPKYFKPQSVCTSDKRGNKRLNHELTHVQTCNFIPGADGESIHCLELLCLCCTKANRRLWYVYLDTGTQRKPWRCDGCHTETLRLITLDFSKWVLKQWTAPLITCLMSVKKPWSQNWAYLDIQQKHLCYASFLGAVATASLRQTETNNLNQQTASHQSERSPDWVRFSFGFRSMWTHIDIISWS